MGVVYVGECYFKSASAGLSEYDFDVTNSCALMFVPFFQ